MAERSVEITCVIEDDEFDSLEEAHGAIVDNLSAMGAENIKITGLED